jgi:WD40 repeat protein
MTHLKQGLSFNMCNLPSSYLLDTEVPALSSLVQQKFSGGLVYACKHWGDHVIHMDTAAVKAFLGKVEAFMQLKVLFWLEAMNLLQILPHAARILRELGEHISQVQQVYNRKRHERLTNNFQMLNCRGLQNSLLNVGDFATMLCGSSARESTPHIYLSGLELGVLTTYFQTPLRINQYNGGSAAVLLTMTEHTDWVTSVVYSPDGKHIVSGSHDNSVQFWDASTGEQVQKLEGHTGEVTSVTYSPDGKHIVFGSDEKSVQVWDAFTGEQVQKLEGHTGEVTSVAYSPDGKHIVSGSVDKSVQVWDAFTGEQVQELEGHTNWVTSVAYSPDGKHIVSGSGDKSVQVWDASTGEQVQELEGHTDWVTSVAYFPDGKPIISGSDANSVQVWGTGLSQFSVQSFIPTDK